MGVAALALSLFSKLGGNYPGLTNKALMSSYNCARSFVMEKEIIQYGRDILHAF